VKPVEPAPKPPNVVGGIELPMPIAGEHVEEDVAKRAGMIPRAEIDHRRRKNPRAVELTAAAEHLGETMAVLDRRQAATAGDLASGCAEELTDGLEDIRLDERGEPAVERPNRALSAYPLVDSFARSRIRTHRLLTSSASRSVMNCSISLPKRRSRIQLIMTRSFLARRGSFIR
jgi:hypothetical protein